MTYLRAFLVWLVLMAAEIVHGIARAVLLVPHVGLFRSNQIGVFSGSLIILLVTRCFIRWIGEARARRLLAVGVFWGVLTLAFELSFGRFVAGASWQQLLADYDMPHGGLMPLGICALVLSPWMAARWAGIPRR